VLTDQVASLCAFCGKEPKSLDHLFETCGVTSSVWYMNFRRLGLELVIPRDVLGLF